MTATISMNQACTDFLSIIFTSWVSVSLPHIQVPVTSWFDDPNDTELLDLIPFFEALDKVDNVLTVLGRSQLQSPSPNSSQNDSSLHDPQQEEL